MKVLESIWFENIGIVKVQTETKGIKFYIGTGRGYDQKMDERVIADWGFKFDPTMAFFSVEREVIEGLPVSALDD